MRRLTSVLAILFLAVPLLAGCGEDENPSGGSSSPTGDGTSTTTIEIEFEGDDVTPKGERVEVAAGEPVELVVKADAPGELHIHTNPEKELAYGAGTTSLKLTIDEPGVVDVEDHELEVVVVQLEVS